jgi:glucose/arabinose dehydrogenase
MKQWLTLGLLVPQLIFAQVIKVPTGFTATEIGQNLGPTRHITVSKQGHVYAKLSKLKDGKGIVQLKDTDQDGVYNEQSGFGNYTGTGIGFHGNYFYAASNTGVLRYALNAAGEIADPTAFETIVDGLPDHGRDNAKPFVFDNEGKYIYVTIGSWNDRCRVPNSGLGMSPCAILDSAGGVWRFDANKLNQGFKDGVRYATGLKNAVGIAWNRQTNTLFAMAHGRGQFDDFYPQYYTSQQSQELPAEAMYEFKKAGDDAGWPYIYFDHKQNKKIQAPEYGGDGKKTGGENALNPVVTFPAHMGPNDLLFYTGNQFPSKYKNGAFIAFHGQSAEIKKGYFVAFVPFKNGKPSGKWEIFADNFSGIDLAKPSGPIQHRPCGLAMGPDGSLFVCDDLGGSIYRIQYKDRS